jgi:hypothetical protein
MASTVSGTAPKLRGLSSIVGIVMLQGRRTLKYFAAIVVVIVAAYIAEYQVRKYPQILPSQWQIRDADIRIKFEVIPDPEVGFRLAPLRQQVIRSHDFSYVRKTDAKGFVNREPWPKTTGIIFLGDSLVTGEGVGIEGQFSNLVSQTLPDQTVLNLALPGAGPERQLHIYRKFGLGLDANLVVACLYLASDLENDASFRLWRRNSTHLSYNDFRLNFRQRIDGGSINHPGRILARSRIVSMAGESLLRWFKKEDQRFRFADGTEILFDRRKLEFAAKVVEADDSALNHMLSSLAELRSLVTQQKAKLLVMLIPSKEEIFGVEPTVQNRNAVARLRRRLQDSGMPFLDLYPTIRERGTVHSPYFSWDTHLNGYGNRLIAEEFLNWFRRQSP